MSLLMTSSSWTNGEQTKKRVPTIRKSIKKMVPTTSLESEGFDSIEAMYSDTLDNDAEELQTDRNLMVNNIIDKMASLKTDNDGDSLENFTPISYPENEGESGNEPENNHKTILPKDYAIKRHHITNSNFTPDTSVKSNNIHSDFNRVYDVSTSKPFYTSGTGLGKKNDNKITDRLSYIVHLLEQQQNEKTDNIFEEYILYILLGTFVILIVDSFSRGGKYVR